MITVTYRVSVIPHIRYGFHQRGVTVVTRLGDDVV